MKKTEKIAKPFLIGTLLGLIPVSAFAWSMFGGSTDFVKNTLLDQPLEAAKAKYHGLPGTTPCNADQKKACQEKSWDCVCHQYQLVSEQAQGRALFLITHANKIVEIHDMRQAQPFNVPSFYPALKVYTGESAPSEVYEGVQWQGYQSYFPVWKSSDLSVAARVWCPLETYGGASQVKTPLRDCNLSDFQASRVQNFTFKMKKVTVTY